MSLNTKKCLLKEDLKPQVDVKSLILPTIVVKNEIIAKWSSKEEIICCDFVYCDNPKCGKKHYYGNKYDDRMEANRIAQHIESRHDWWIKTNEQTKILNRVLRRLEKRLRGRRLSIDDVSWKRS
jgi:hypothetical protein